jgi:DNA-binding NtrC family response regulator
MGVPLQRLRRPRVFVLDDQHLVADSLARILESHGFEAHARCRSADILDLASEREPDLLLTDVSLGPDEINGIDLAIYFERFFPRCRAILISGDPDTGELHRRAREAGHDFLLIEKPIHPDRLLKVLNDTLKEMEQHAA